MFSTLLCFAIIAVQIIPEYRSFSIARIRLSIVSKSYLSSTSLNARTARKEEEKNELKQSPEDEATIKIPYDGLMGFEQGTVFSTPLQVYDPLDDVDDLPGEEGSDEKLEAIQKRIDDRVAAMRKAGEWNDDEIENYGKDPLRNIPLPSTMLMQMKACKPYDSPSELLLTYILLMITTIVLGGYVIVLRDSLESFMQWYVNTDFDSDFFSKLNN